jgi:hypothetical protein
MWLDVHENISSRRLWHRNFVVRQAPDTSIQGKAQLEEVRLDHNQGEDYCTAIVTPGGLLALPTVRTTGTAPEIMPSGTRALT